MWISAIRWLHISDDGEPETFIVNKHIYIYINNEAADRDCHTSDLAIRFYRRLAAFFTF